MRAAHANQAPILAAWRKRGGQCHTGHAHRNNCAVMARRHTGGKPHGKLTNHDSLLIRRAAPADGKFAIVCYTSGRTYAHSKPDSDMAESNSKPDSDTAESKDMSRRGLLTWGFTNPGNQNGTLNVPTPAVARQKLGRYKTISRYRAVNVTGSNPATTTSSHRRSSPGTGAQHTQLTCAGLRKSEKKNGNSTHRTARVKW